ncbi:hypothetical protein [Clostridium luticellarii]|jgi:hypothetical protein|uniref:Uncharacterized protein n=1 Tax=Clostridium luticellarii TaxID=1691940 RepID=A0A2T0BRM5_9CLOT|nr:hypothetical protein [Clostridium luticellarii]MCI1943774.1 hypothetical protein [Clostridium luticellarii]MCI1967035.1 hypothetical protein [Clostridium luticellarii]MCI1994402.1 hypothetical protein [Clostridium luticellarii]MCI2038645.1 hypothetical protein [Clostridium luticellarii]PRR86519.1 hypothetical protein CLLU_03200 [Clostridium luticellarii]
MRKNEKILFENICKYCIGKYTLLSSGPLIPSLICQLCKYADMDVPVIRGILRVQINENYIRSFAHCFNIYNGSIIDASIYEYALTNKAIGHLFPIYILDNIPPHIDYIMQEELVVDSQVKFSEQFLKNSLEKIQNNNLEFVKRFTLIEDSKKENLFYCH